MTSLTHLLVGGAVGAAVSHWTTSTLGGSTSLFGGSLVTLVAAALMGLLSHFAFDLIPHNDYLYYFKNKWRIIYLSPLSWAFLVGGGLAIFLLGWGKSNWLTIWTGAFFGLLPDVLTALNKIFGSGANRFDQLHWQLHGRRDLGEIFYRKWGGGVLVGRDESGHHWTDFNHVKASFWGKVGWGVELLAELGVVILSVKFLLS